MSNPSTFEFPAVNRDRLLSRFLQYVQVETTANPSTDKYPSSEGQRVLGKILAEQLAKIGLTDVQQDEWGLVWATIPATDGGNSATVALLAHMDTSPEAPGKDVNPQVVENYQGGDIQLLSGRAMLAKDNPDLHELIGKTLITTDGKTLLGGDDKTGVAILMELAAYLIEHPFIPHGEVRLIFTCDEEIGRGTNKIDLERVNATVAYTLDGGGAGLLDVETFSADAATVTFHGNNIHPAIAKGQMINAVRAACDFVDRLPRASLAPESTEGRQPFIHPYQISGGVGDATVELLLRSFDTHELDELAQRIQTHAEATEAEFPGLVTRVAVRKQYRNLRDGLKPLPEAVTLARQAFENLGRHCQETIVRGGTDGSQLTEMGLPTPNLSSGQHNIHSTHEFACLDEMIEALEHVAELLRLWSQHSQA